MAGPEITYGYVSKDNKCRYAKHPTKLHIRIGRPNKHKQP